MTLANLLTFVRILLTPLIIWLLLSNKPGLAAILFLIAAFSDWIDGTVARAFNQISELGKFLDPLADKIIVLSVLIALAGKGAVSCWPVIILLFRELAISGLRTEIAKRGLQLGARLSGKIKMVLEALAILALILGWEVGTPLLWLAVAAAIISGIEYFMVYRNVWR